MAAKVPQPYRLDGALTPNLGSATMSFSRHEGDLPKFPGVISAAELMARGERNRHASLERNPHWHYDAGVRVLWTKAGGDRYEVDLERIPDVAEFADYATCPTRRGALRK